MQPNIGLRYSCPSMQINELTLIKITSLQRSRVHSFLSLLVRYVSFTVA